MAVLSDKTIKERINKKELVPNGNVDSAKHCSYEFTAALMLRGGSHESNNVTPKGVVIKPAELVWIKANEEIAMPPDMVGLWIQTQTLARQGLLLLNITLIEPGYEGPLSAVFVNFGNKSVVIDSNTKIAKVIFLPLDNAAINLIENSDFDKYDKWLKDMSANAPETFLQLQTFLPNLEERAKAKLDAIEKEIERSVNDVVKKTRTAFKDDLQGDLKGTLLKWGGGVVAGFLISCAVVWLMISTLLPRLAEYSKIDTMARKAAVVQQAETITGLRKQLQKQTTAIESIKEELKELQLQRNTSGTMTLPGTGNGASNK